MSSTQQIIKRRDAFMCRNYPRYPIAMVRGEGVSVWDADEKQYLDLFSGFGATLLGHGHPDLIDAVTEQAKTLWHVGNLFHTEPQTRAAEAISKFGFGGRSFFCHSGADANEAAIKLARLYGKAKSGNMTAATGRYKIISTHRSFHGRSFGTMPATGQPKVREGFEPALSGYVNVEYGDVQHVADAIDDETVAVIVEPIQGEGGVNVPPDNYLPDLRKLCDEHDLLLICDEVWTGCGRTGKAFAHQHWLSAEQAPDIMTLGKGVGGGLAVGVMCARPHVAELYDAAKAGGVKHATTLGGNPLSLAVTARIFEVMQRDNLVQRAAELGGKIAERLRSFAASCEAVREVRGKGLFVGVQLDPDRGWFDSGTDIVNRCLEQGVIINCTQQTVLRLAPALTVPEQQVHDGLDVVERIIKG